VHRQLCPRTPSAILGLTDLSDISRLGLRIIADLARLLDADLECLHVVPMHPAMPASDRHWPMVLASETAEDFSYTIEPDPWRDRAQETDVVAAGCHPSAMIDTSISHAVEAAAHQREFDLVAMLADEGHHRLQRQRFRPHTGHAARSVLKRVELPVMILPLSFVVAVEEDVVFSHRADKRASNVAAR